MTLDSYIDIVTSYQVAQERLQEFQEGETAHAASKFMKTKEQSYHRIGALNPHLKTSIVANSVEIFRKELCPGYGKVCHKCSRKGHFRSVCRIHKEVSHVQVEDVQVVQLHHITEAMKQRQVFATFKMNKNVEVPFQLDTGTFYPQKNTSGLQRIRILKS